MRPLNLPLSTECGRGFYSKKSVGTPRLILHSMLNRKGVAFKTKSRSSQDLYSLLVLDIPSSLGIVKTKLDNFRDKG